MLDELRSNPEFSVAFGLLERSGLSDILSCGDDLTFLVPTNSAFADLPPSTLEFLIDPENIDALRSVLLYHMVPGRRLSQDLEPGSLATLLPGNFLTVGTSPFSFDSVPPTSADNQFSNGVIHVIESVLDLSDLSYDESFCSSYDFGGSSAVGMDDDGMFILNSTNVTIDSDSTCSPNLLDQARNHSDLQFFVELVDFAGLTDIFDCPGPFTGLLPNNGE